MKIYNLYSDINHILHEINSKHNFLYNHLLNNIHLITDYENSYNKLINKINIYYKKLPNEIINFNKNLIKNNFFIKNKFQLKFTNIIILYKIKLYIKHNSFKKYYILKKHYIDFYKTFLYKKNFNNLLLYFTKLNTNNINIFSDISKKNLYLFLKQKLKNIYIYPSEYYTDNQLILIYHNLFEINNNEIQLLKHIPNDFIKLNNIFNYFFNILLYTNNYVKNKKYIIKNLNIFYKNCKYFVNEQELIEITTKNIDLPNLSNFILKLKNIIKLIYNKNIKKKINNNLYQILYFKYKLIYT